MNLKPGMNILANHHPVIRITNSEPHSHPVWELRGECARRSHLKINVLCLTLVAHHSGQEACCSFSRWICEVHVESPNCLQIKSEAWGSCNLEW